MAQQLLQEMQLFTHLSAVTAEISPLEEGTMSVAVVTTTKSLASPLFCEKHPWEEQKAKGKNCLLGEGFKYQTQGM